MNKITSLLISIGLSILVSCNNNPGNRPNEQDLGKCPVLPQIPDSYPQPRMWVAAGVSSGYEKNFYDMARYLKIQIHKDETDSFYYDAQEFADMVDTFSKEIPNIKYVDLVPVVFSAEHNPGVPSGRGDNLVFLFRTVDSLTSKTVYYLLPENSKTFSTKDDSVHSDTVISWTDNYKKTIVPWFNAKYLDSNDKANFPGHDNSDIKNLTNTTFIRYFLEDVQALPNEICFQAAVNKDTIVGYRLYFSAIPDRGKGHQDAYSNRLLSEFEFMMRDKSTGTLYPFYLESTTDWRNRPPQSKRYELSTFDHLKGLDNGQLCPPRCN